MAGVFEVAILARVRWNLHSLNNEGTLGNVTEPRTVVLANGKKTDGVSGEMLKHIHAFYMWLLGDKDKFCEPCKEFSPMKADHEKKGVKATKKDGAEGALDKALPCPLCDLHGFMLTHGVAVARPSTLEFGWAVGLPDQTHRSLHLHARHEMGSEVRQEGEEAGERTAQMLYHRPTRSGVYAFVSVFQPWRISLNEVVYKYVNDIDERKKRMELALEAYKALFMRTDGAMTTTRLPHTEGIEGVVVVSRKPFPAPVISPLKDGYEQEIRSICNSNGLEPKPFGGLEEFCALMDELKNEKPYDITAR